MMLEVAKDYITRVHGANHEGKKIDFKMKNFCSSIGTTKRMKR